MLALISRDEVEEIVTNFDRPSIRRTGMPEEDLNDKAVGKAVETTVQTTVETAVETAVEKEDGVTEPHKLELTELQTFARGQGWNPNFDGPEAKTAEEFLNETQNIMRQASQDVNRLKSDIEDLKKGQTQSLMDGLSQRQDLEPERRREKANAGDMDGYDLVAKTISGLPTAAPVKELEDPVKVKYLNVENRFVGEAKWYNGSSKDEVQMTMTANQAAAALSMQQIESMTEEQIYSAIEGSVQRAFPEKFASPKQKPDGYIGDTPGGSGTGGGASTSFSIKLKHKCQTTMLKITSNRLE